MPRTIIDILTTLMLSQHWKIHTKTLKKKKKKTRVWLLDPHWCCQANFPPVKAGLRLTLIKLLSLKTYPLLIRREIVMWPHFLHTYISYHTLEIKHTSPLLSCFIAAVAKSFTVSATSFKYNLAQRLCGKSALIVPLKVATFYTTLAKTTWCENRPLILRQCTFYQSNYSLSFRCSLVCIHISTGNVEIF